MKATRALVSLSLLASLTAMAANLDLALTVSGTRTAAPKWQDGASSDITTADFAFSGVVGAAATDVESAVVDIKLVDALSYPATANVTVPSGCAIGANSVSAGDVKVVADGVVAGGTLSFANDTTTKAIKVRFAAAGNYGDKSGAVACSTAGQFRYSY